MKLKTQDEKERNGRKLQAIPTITDRKHNELETATDKTEIGPLWGCPNGDTNENSQLDSDSPVRSNEKDETEMTIKKSRLIDDEGNGHT